MNTTAPKSLKFPFTNDSLNITNISDENNKIITLLLPVMNATTIVKIKTDVRTMFDLIVLWGIMANDNKNVPANIQKSPKGVMYENTLHILAASPTLAIPFLSSTA